MIRSFVFALLMGAASVDLPTIGISGVRYGAAAA